MFFRAQIFKDFNHLSKESLVFENFHNNNHRYSKLKGKIPWVIHSSITRRILSPSFSLHKRSIPFEDGKLSFVRLTNKEGKVRFFTESFSVDKDLANEYVKGTIFTKQNLLKFYYDGRIIRTYKYKVNKR